MTQIEAPSPDANGRVAAESISRAALSAVPLVGGAAVEAFQFAVGRGRQRRFNAWVEDVTAALNDHGTRLESLEDNDAFLDAIGAAARAAVETADDDKLHMLRNAVVNAAIGLDLDADRRAILLDVLTSLTATHLRVLRLFDNPEEVASERGVDLNRNIMLGSPMVAVESVYPSLAADPILLERVVADLNDKGLSEIPLRTMMTAGGIYTRRTKPLGEALLELVAAVG